jgi:hypothetical protein
VNAIRFYKEKDQSVATHLALSWKGRVRYTVPRDSTGRRACWQVFHPGQIEVPLRAMARFPKLLGAVSCVEDESLAIIRGEIGNDVGLSSCRVGAEGVWQKYSILFLDKTTTEPLYIVKAGFGEGVNTLLENEASWLKHLREQPSLAPYIPELVAYHPGTDLCFIAQSVLSGTLEFELENLQLEFLRKLQVSSFQSLPYEDSKLYKAQTQSIEGLSRHLTSAWSTRLDLGLEQINQSLSGATIALVAAHRDFTPWNVRIENGISKVFDWEFADSEQFPMFDPLHFALTPLALKGRSTGKLIQCIFDTLRLCQDAFDAKFCYEGKAQALGYLIGICTFYLSSVKGNYDTNPVLDSYALVIDRLCAT